MILNNAMRHLRAPVFWLMIVLASANALVTLTGCYDVLPNQDLVWDTTNAYNLLHHGEIPLHSGVSSLYAMIPPGVSFGLVPGMLIVPGNPAMAEHIGAALLFFGCLLGLYCWIKPRLGSWAAALSMLLFSVGQIGVFFAASLWPRAHPFFYVWMLYLLTLWVEKRRGRYLALALIVYAAGMYWYMEMVPALFVAAILYVLYRPPMGWKPLAAATAVGLAIWSPYLVFEASRDFADAKAIVTTSYMPGVPEFSSVLYNKGNRLVKVSEIRSLKNSGATDVHLTKPTDTYYVDTPQWGMIEVHRGDTMYLNEPGYIFYSPKIGWAFQSYESGRLLLYGKKDWEPGTYAIPFPDSHAKVRVPETTLSEKLWRLRRFAPLFNFGGDQNPGIWAWHVSLMAAALIAAFFVSGLPRQNVAAWRSWRSSPNPFVAHETEPAVDSRRLAFTVLWTGVVVPVAVLLMLLHRDDMFTGDRRFWWLWIAEAALIGGMLGSMRIRGGRILVPVGLLAVATLAVNPNMQNCMKGSFTRWPGSFHGKSEMVIDATAALIKSEGLDRTSIGYDMNQYGWTPGTRRIDGRAKSFIEWDVVFLTRHGITNLDTNAEGLSPNDRFRIRDPNYDAGIEALEMERWSMTLDGSLPPMQTVEKVAGLEILRK
jgi:hypothetical protein